METRDKKIYSYVLMYIIDGYYVFFAFDNNSPTCVCAVLAKKEEKNS